MSLAFYWLEVCPSCQSYHRADQITAELAALAKTDPSIKFASHNLAFGGAYDAFESELKKRGLSNLRYSLPVLLINDRYVTGYDDIEAEIHKLSARKH